MANAQLKQLNNQMQLSLAHLYYVTLAFLALWFIFLVVSVALKEHEAAGPGYICVGFVMLYIWLMDLVDTKLRKLKLLQSSFEVRQSVTGMHDSTSACDFLECTAAGCTGTKAP